MDLVVGLRTTGAVREFTDEPVTDEQLVRILDAARFAPNGGNAQAWRVVVLRDPQTRRALRDLYVDTWRLYLAQSAAGMRPWAPITDLDAERRAIEAAERGEVQVPIGEFADHLDEVPALLVVLADLRLLAAIDRDLPRYGFVGGASIYPFVWSLLLAAHAEALGGVITTMAVRHEEQVRELVGAPGHLAVAGVVALGRPRRRPTRLRRRTVGEFATVDRIDGPPMDAP